MTMFRNIKDFLAEYKKFGSYEGAAIFDDWSEFKQKFITAKDSETEQQLVEACGFKYETYQKIIEASVYNWKDSVSTSLFHGIGEIGYKMPNAGDAVFNNMTQQTRFLTICFKHGLMRQMMDCKPFRKDNEIVRISGTTVYTILPDYIKKFNNILRMLFLYQYWHRKMLKKGLKSKEIKLPKKLYRGIRTHNLYNNPKILELIKQSDRQDMSYEERRKNSTDILLDWLYKNNINKLTDGRLTSFTSSKPTAEYFANGEGFILSVDPTKVEIVTSELTASEFQEADYVSNRKEKEYIIRIPDGYKIKPEDIEIVDKEYLLAAKNPLAVQWLDHDDIYIEYNMGDKKIRAGYSWHSNDRGSISFSIKQDDDRWSWMEGKNNFKKAYGFDPMPSAKNIDQITGFEIIKRNN